MKKLLAKIIYWLGTVLAFVPMLVWAIIKRVKATINHKQE